MLREWYRQEKQKLEVLDTRQKAEYIWQYYKLWIIGIVCAVLFAIYAGYLFFNNVTEYWIYLAFVNTRVEVGQNTPLWDGFVEYSGYDTKEKLVAFDNNAYFTYGNNRNIGNAYYEAFVAYIDAGTLDAATMNPEELIAFGASGRLLDLNSEECVSIKEKYGDKFLYCEPYDEEYSADLVPVGIDLSDSILINQYHIYSNEKCALGIGAQSQHVEAVEKFLDYVFEEGK